MIRRTISLVLALTLTLFLVGVHPSVVRSGSGSGDVDPTGLDTGHHLMSAIPDHDSTPIGLRDIGKTGVITDRWIQMFFFKVLLRSFGL